MKNYLLMADENAMQYFKAIMPALQFIEVKGMNIKEFPNDTFLTTLHVEPVEIKEPVESPVIIDEGGNELQG